MDFLSLKPELRQHLRLNPQILQSMEVLQMNAQELLSYLQRAGEENPVLELEDDPDLAAAWQSLRRRAEWLDRAAPAPAEAGAPDREAESLAAFLRDQLDRLHLPGPLLSLAQYLAELLDEDGYLDAGDLESVRELGVPPALLDQALSTLRSLEPPGVGALDLPQCLLLQLSRRQDVPPGAAAIAERFLPELGRGHYGPICRALDLTAEEVREAGAYLAALEPRPGRSFSREAPPVYVRPDILVVEEGEELRVVLNEFYLPRVTISPYYEALSRETEEEETRAYLREKLRQARWLLDHLERRGSTLRRCAQAIVKRQLPFFTGKSAALSPMGLSSLAEELDLHPSTVSRATRGKYLQCRRGTFPLRFFFSRSLGGERGVSSQSVKVRLSEIIRGEDPRHPLSDQALCALLNGSGAPVARRTVAKYRMELGIPSSAGRRRG